MRVEENVLREVLQEAVADLNNKPKSAKDKFKELMFNMYNYTAGEATDVINGTLPVDLMQKDMLFRVTKVLFELNNRIGGTFDSDKLLVDTYFTEREIEDFNFKIDRNKQDEDIIIPQSQWVQVEDDQYIIVLSIDDIMDKFISKNKVQYNPETQRDLTIKETKTGKVKVITWFPQAFTDICNAMESGNHISDGWTFNMNPDKCLPPKISKGNLIITKESIIDCIDGFHRLRAAIAVKLKRPEWNKKFYINLMVFDKEKANQFILQEDIKNHLSEKQTSSIDPLDAANFIIDKLNMSSKFHLKNSIDDNMKFIINKIMQKTFEPKKLYSSEERQEAVEIFNFILDNMNELVEDKQLYDKVITKEEWFVYMYILNYCRSHDKSFMNILNNLDVNGILNKVSFKNEPLAKHYTYMNEVIRNV